MKWLIFISFKMESSSSTYESLLAWPILLSTYNLNISSQNMNNKRTLFIDLFLKYPNWKFWRRLGTLVKEQNFKNFDSSICHI
jgi:hypothetical protein